MSFWLIELNSFFSTVASIAKIVEAAVDEKQKDEFFRYVRERLDVDDEHMYAKVAERHFQSRKRELIIGRILLIFLPLCANIVETTSSNKLE